MTVLCLSQSIHHSNETHPRSAVDDKRMDWGAIHGAEFRVLDCWDPIHGAEFGDLPCWGPYPWC